MSLHQPTRGNPQMGLFIIILDGSRLQQLHGMTSFGNFMTSQGLQQHRSSILEKGLGRNGIHGKNFAYYRIMNGGRRKIKRQKMGEVHRLSLNSIFLELLNFNVFFNFVTITIFTKIDGNYLVGNVIGISRNHYGTLFLKDGKTTSL